VKIFIEIFIARIIAVPIRLVQLPRSVLWKIVVLVLTIYFTTAGIMQNLIPEVNRYADKALICQQELFALGVWVMLIGLIVRRLEEEKFWQLWLYTVIFAAWIAFLFSETSTGFLATS
jgi:hypothetical protein